MQHPMTQRFSYRKYELRRALAMSLMLMRLRHGYSQRALAEKVGMKQPAIARIESGRKLPSLRILEKIALAYDGNIRLQIETPENLSA